MNATDEDFRERKKQVNLFYFAAIIIGVHGIFFGFFEYVMLPFFAHSISGFTEHVFFWAFSAPALCLAYPLNGLLWKLRLMNVPGFMAWPKSAGFALVYLIWTGGFVVLGLIGGAIRQARKR